MQAIQSLDGVQPTAVADANPDMAAGLAQRFAVPAFTPDELLARGDVDVVDPVGFCDTPSLFSPTDRRLEPECRLKCQNFTPAIANRRPIQRRRP